MTESYEDLWDITGGVERFSVIGNNSMGVGVVLLPQNHSHDVPPPPTDEQLEKENQRQFELLQVLEPKIVE